MFTSILHIALEWNVVLCGAPAPPHPAPPCLTDNYVFLDCRQKRASKMRVFALELEPALELARESLSPMAKRDTKMTAS